MQRKPPRFGSTKIWQEFCQNEIFHCDFQLRILIRSKFFLLHIEDTFLNENFLIMTQCFPPELGGIQSLMGGLAQTLATCGATVTVYADACPNAKDTDIPFAIRRFSGLKPLRRWRKAVAGREMAIRHRVSRIFCDSWKSLEYLSPPPSVQVTVFAHGTEYPLSPSPRKRERILSSLRKADRVIAVSAATRERIHACVLDATRVEVWHPAIDEPPPASPEDRARASVMWGSSETRLFTIARLTRRKGVDTAIRAVAGLTTTHPTLRYLIAGDGPEVGALHDLAVRIGVQENVKFIGVVSASLRSALYESADVFVLPSHPVRQDIEGFGLVFIEAGYFGLPVVAGRGGGAAEAVIDNTTGKLCDGTDSESVKRGLAALLANESQRQQFGENAKMRANSMLWPVRLQTLM